MALMLLLLMPKSWILDFIEPDTLHRIELTLSTPDIEQEKTQTDPTPEVSPPTEPITTPQSTQPTPSPKPIPKQEPKPQPNPTPQPSTSAKAVKEPPTPAPKQVETSPKLSSGQVLRMMQQPTDVDISDTVFAPSDHNHQSFQPHVPVAQAWQSDLPYLDESVDRPRVQMNFYSEGFMGSVERFFDKITYEKTFTTKYGTKIHCALVALITVCSWK